MVALKYFDAYYNPYKISHMLPSKCFEMSFHHNLKFTHKDFKLFSFEFNFILFFYNIKLEIELYIAK